MSQSRFKFIELKCWSSENSGIVKDLEILIQHAEVSDGFLLLSGKAKASVFQEKETGEKGFVERKKWIKLKTVWHFADALLNRMAVERLTRPYDYTTFVIFRCLHCARWFCKIESDEARQLELLLAFYVSISEKNINRARAGKPPCTFEETWQVVRHCVQRHQKNPDNLMCGSAYTSASNKSMEKKFKERGLTIERLNGEVTEQKKKIKSLESDLKALKSGRNKDKPSKDHKPAVASGSFRTLKEKVDSCCPDWNRDPASCDGQACASDHKCSWTIREAGKSARVCWAAHPKCQHPR